VMAPTAITLADRLTARSADGLGHLFAAIAQDVLVGSQLPTYGAAMFRVITLFSCGLAITTAPLLRWPPRLPVWRDGVITVDTQTTPPASRK